MNVLQIAHSYRPSLGGIENYSYRLSRSLEEAGNSVSVVTTDTSLLNSSSPLDREENVAYCKTTASVFRNPVSIELYQRLKDSNATICHLHSPWFISTLEAVLALPQDIPLVLTIHGFQPFRGIKGRILDAIYKPIAEYIFSRIDQIIVLGESEKRRLIKEYDIDSNTLSVVPNAIHPNEHDVNPDTITQIRCRYNLQGEAPTVLFVSRLVPLKNPDIIVDAISQHMPEADLNVVMVGNGPDDFFSALQTRADDRFQFRANLSFEDLQALYHASDLFVLPSQAEGLPTVVLEAMNARLPVIVTPVGALNDVVRHRENGWVLEDPPTLQEVANAIRYYVTQPVEREKVGRRNRKYIREAFDWADVANSIIDIYNKVLDHSHRSVPHIS